MICIIITKIFMIETPVPPLRPSRNINLPKLNPFSVETFVLPPYTPFHRLNDRRLRRSIRTLAESQPYLQKLSNLDARERLLRWRTLNSNEEVELRPEGWQRSWQELSPQMKRDSRVILQMLGMQFDPSSVSPHLSQWQKLFHDLYQNGNLDAKFLMKSFKRLSKENLTALEAVLRLVVGKDVADDLFTEGGGFFRSEVTGVTRPNQKDKVITDMEINQYKADLTSKAEEYDRAFEEIKFHLNDKQRQDIQQALRLLPVELLSHIEDVRLVKLKPGELKLAYTPVRILGRATLHGPPELYEDGTWPGTFGVFHEIGGHGLLNMIGVLDRRSYDEIVRLWKEELKKNPNLIHKDSYARGYLKPWSKMKEVPIRLFAKGFSIPMMPLYLEEFVADRMAEFFFEHAFEQAYNPFDDSDENLAPFTFDNEESRRMTELCRKTYTKWKELVYASSTPSKRSTTSFL